MTSRRRVGQPDPVLASIATLASRFDRLVAALAERDRELAATRATIATLWSRVERLERRAQRGQAPPSRREPEAAEIAPASAPEPRIAGSVTVERAAELLDASTRHIRRLGDAGELDLIDVRTPAAPRPAWRVSVSSLEALLERRRVLGSAPVPQSAVIPGRSRADARKGG